MKKLLAIIISILTLALMLLACAAPEEAVTSPDSTGGAGSDEPEEPVMQKITEAEVKDMLPIMDSIILCMGEGGFDAHDATDCDYFWSLMYYN